MWFLIITILYLSSLLSTSASYLCHTHLAVSLTSLDFFQRKTEKVTPLAIRKSLSATCYSAIFYSCAWNRITPLRVQVCVHVCVCVISTSWESLSSGWPRGWWSVALPSSLCWQPQGDHTNTHAYKDIKTTQTHTCTHSQWDACRRLRITAPGTFGASGLSLSCFLLVSLSLHELNFSLCQQALHSDSMQSQKSHETKLSRSMKTNIQQRNRNQIMFLFQKADKMWILRRNTDSSVILSSPLHQINIQSVEWRHDHEHTTKASFWYSALLPTVTYYIQPSECSINLPPSFLRVFLPLSAPVLWMLL